MDEEQTETGWEKSMHNGPASLKTKQSKIKNPCPSEGPRGDRCSQTKRAQNKAGEGDEKRLNLGAGQTHKDFKVLLKIWNLRQGSGSEHL